MSTNAGTHPSLLCSARLALALISFLGCVILYASRSNLSFSLVCMVNQTAIQTTDISELPKHRVSECQADGNVANKVTVSTTGKSNSVKAPQQDGEFAWSKGTQGALLSAFFWGYTSSQIIGGTLGNCGWWTASSWRRNGLATLLSPIAARLNVVSFIVLRALLGLSQGSVFPAMQQMWSLWAPPLERSLLTGVSFAGAQIGNVLVMPLSGLLCRYGWDGGWPMIYYLLGVFGIVWAVLWLSCVSDSPQKHRRIQEDERNYIMDSLQDTVAKEDTRPPVPWKAVFTSKAVWACFIGHFAGDWGAYTMATSLPLYMNDVMGYDLTALGFISSVPYVAYFLMINVAGFVADLVRKHQLLSTLNTRRSAMLLAFGFQALFLLLIGTAGCGQETLVIVYLTIGIGMSGIQYAGVCVNYLDIAPSFVGPIFGLGNTISCVAGIFSPLVMGWLTPTGSKAEWQMVFMVAALILVAGALLFCVFADGEVQEWARSHRNLPQVLQEPLLPLSNDSTDGKESTDEKVKPLV
ncbi:MFS domain-containing protein [Aphelenchoides bicaudatus]|nr:MFS domain-containing protein [Aphelenchoides bicaudatus]